MRRKPLGDARGVASRRGAVINQAVLDSVTTEFPVFGTAGIDIVMTD